MTETISKTKEPLQRNKLLINEQIVEIDNPADFKWKEVYLSIKNLVNLKNKYIIKLNLVKSTKNKLYFNLVYLENFAGFIEEPFSSQIESEGLKPESSISCLIIPTGTGASFGGYAGDANPIAKAFSTQCKYLLTHPNVVNGAVLSSLPSNLIYLEGFLLDQFLLGKINLIPNKQNKIGVVFDKGITEERLHYEINVLNALKVYWGCDIIGWTVSKKPLLVTPCLNKLGFSSGEIINLESIIEEALKLKDLGATAIAICCLIPDSNLNKDYIYGKGIDPTGGIEATISHAISSATGLVAAHAPALVSNEKINYKKISPLAAAEYIAKTFLPSVIGGLCFAPRLEAKKSKTKNHFSYLNLKEIIVPYNGFGSPGVLALSEASKNIILIKENKTCLDVDPNHININFSVIDKYTNMLDLEKVKQEGIELKSLTRPVDTLPEL